MGHLGDLGDPSGNCPIRRSVRTDSCHHTIPNFTVPYHTVSYHTVPYRTIPYHTRYTIHIYRATPYHTIVYQLTAATASQSSHSACVHWPSTFRQDEELWPDQPKDKNDKDKDKDNEKCNYKYTRPNLPHSFSMRSLDSQGPFFHLAILDWIHYQ